MDKLLCLLFSLFFLAARSQDTRPEIAGEFESDNAEMEYLFVPYQVADGWCLFDAYRYEPDLRFHFDAIQLSNSEFNSNYIFELNNSFGVISMTGDTLLSFVYDSIVPFGSDYICLTKDNWWYCENDSVRIDLHADHVFLAFPYLYTYKNGLKGIMNSNQRIAEPVYDAIHPMECNEVMQSANSFFFLALKNGRQFLLNVDGDHLIPDGAEDIQCFEHGVIRFLQGNWQYYLPELKRIVNPEGNDIVFYSGSTYKIYNADRSAASLVFEGEKTFSGTYDDYFIISNDKLAVRKNGKLGMIDYATSKQLIAPRFDKIEEVDGQGYGVNSEDLYKYFKGDSCGMMSMNGKVYFEAKYANILKTAHPERFIVFAKGFCGVVNREGKEILPIIYDYLIVDSERIRIQRKGKFGLADINGRISIPVEFRRIDKLPNDENYYPKQINYVCQGFNRRWQLADRDGIISSGSFDMYNYGNGNFKGYSGDILMIYILDENGRVEELQEYKQMKSLVVEDVEINDYVVLESWPVSYLEENQLSGLFGLRYYTKHGLGADAEYVHVRANYFSSFLGEEDYSISSFPFADKLTLSSESAYANLNLNTGTLVNELALQSETVLHGSSTINSHAAMIDVNLKHCFDTEADNPLSPREMIETPVYYSDNAHAYLKRLFIGGTVRICPIDSARISLFDYYRYINCLNNFKADEGTLKTIMNPELGVYFPGGKERLVERYTLDQDDHYERFLSSPTFDEFEFIGNTELNYRKKVGAKDGLIQSYQGDESGKHLNKSGVLGWALLGAEYQELLELREEGSTACIIHEDYPSFTFLPNEKSLSYHSGRIIQLIDSATFALRCPDGRYIVRNAKSIRYLNEDMFGIEDEWGWKISDREGNLVGKAGLLNIGTFRDGSITIRSAAGSEIMKKNGELIVDNAASMQHIADSKYQITGQGDAYLFDVNTRQKDVLQEKEAYIGGDFIVSKTGENTFAVRKFASKETLILKTEGKPVLFGENLYAHWKNSAFKLTQELELLRYKHTDRLNVLIPQIALISGKKQDVLVNPKGEIIYTLASGANVEGDYQHVLVTTNDTSYLVNQNGEISAYRSLSERIVLPDLSDKKDAYVFQDKGKYGVKNDRQILIPAIYENLLPMGNREYSTRVFEKKALYSSDLELLFPLNYDQIYPLIYDLFLVKIGQDYFLYTYEGELIDL